VSVRAVLLDALGTLVRLEPPAPRLREQLRAYGLEVSGEATERAFAAEIAYYLEHHGEGRDPAALAVLRDRCAAVLARELGLERAEPGVVRQAMLGSLEFTPFEEVPEALAGLRERGLRLVVASNWDCSLPEVLERAGLSSLVDGVVSSAVAGAPKPHPAVFREALRVAGVGAAEAVHVGDSERNDIEGARAAGVRALLVLRGGKPPPGVESVRSLAELAPLLFPR
jgi:putative hydrolase of the HAD superfamily